MLYDPENKSWEHAKLADYYNLSDKWVPGKMYWAMVEPNVDGKLDFQLKKQNGKCFDESHKLYEMLENLK